MKHSSAILAVAVILLVHSNVDALTRPSSIQFVNNSYTGVVVAINNQVAEDENLIKQIKDMFIEASKYLYEATRKRAYFKEVTILVPKTWTPKLEYELPGNVTFDYADVIVAPPNPRWAPLAYTKQYQGCGKQGVHIHFMDAFLTDPITEQYYGPLGRILVHEWGHLRWGLFDEYPDPVGDPDNYQEFYYAPDTQQFEGVRCSYDYKAMNLIFDPKKFTYRECVGNPNIGYEDGCVYYILTKQDSVTSSIMYSAYSLDPIKYFCDDDGQDNSNFHNRDAPNKHNRLCDSRSNWEVLQEHEDFKGGRNPPIDLTEEDLVPNFKMVQHRDVSVVVLMDTSGSMGSDNRFNKMISSTANYISSIVIDGSYIGLVEFSSAAYVLSDLTFVTSDDDRQALLQSLPDPPGGGTGIGGGLLRAIEVLSQNGRDPSGGIILLLTDGQENGYPFIDDVMGTVTESGVIVDTLAFTQAADSKLFTLSENTGGNAFYYSNINGSNTLYEAFAATMERGDVIDAEKRLELMVTSWRLGINETRKGSVYMDSTLGNNTMFSFSWTDGNSLAIDVTIRTPNGSRIDSSYEGYGVDTSFRIISVQIKGTAQAGAWEFWVTNKIFLSQDIAISISSNPASADVDPIIVTSELSGSITDFANGEPLTAFAEIRQGFSPMIYANVWATIERPAGYDPIDIQLLDNGAGADVTKNDGVYSRFFTDFTGVGYYGIKISVDNDMGNAIIIDSIPFSKARPIVDPDQAFNLPAIGGVQIPPPGAQPSEPTGQPAPIFSRDVSGGSSRVDETPVGFLPGADVFPPGDILDLRVKGSSWESGIVTLVWTAPGDDLDNGAASLYEIVRAESIFAWQNDSSPESHRILNPTDIHNGNISAPLDFGTLEEYTILVPKPEGANVVSYAFVLRAFDDAGNPSGFSNAVQAVLRETIPVAPVTDPTPEAIQLEDWMIALIVVGGCVVLALFILGVYACSSCFCKKEKAVAPIMVNEAVVNEAYQNELYDNHA
ncbi:calcium-activated chloride channel regulator 1-like [Asterias rubens]|uniref:calcium-activated chloride channel regulator 1-like n=1 Tax=Asterias rubens TaxID=7604 RepID=UPI001455725B|nr:calcium-activated chloride channel regulator 1-like [Asterias rubens]